MPITCEGVQALVGVDLSHYQTAIKPAQIRNAHLDFVGIQVTQGAPSQGGFINNTAAGNIKSAGIENIVPVFYHYLWPGQGAEQARFFYQSTKALYPNVNTSVMVVDVEGTVGKGPSHDDLCAFLSVLDKLRGNIATGIYTLESYWTPAGFGTGFGGRWLWWPGWLSNALNIRTLAGQVTPPGHPGDPFKPFGPWTHYAIRQFSSSASMSGYNAVDADITFLTVDQLKALGR